MEVAHIGYMSMTHHHNVVLVGVEYLGHNVLFCPNGLDQIPKAQNCGGQMEEASQLLNEGGFDFLSLLSFYYIDDRHYVNQGKVLLQGLMVLKAIVSQYRFHFCNGQLRLVGALRLSTRVFFGHVFYIIQYWHYTRQFVCTMNFQVMQCFCQIVSCNYFMS